MDTFLAYWAEDGDRSLDTFETEQEAVDCLEEWIERRRDDAADEGWPLGMRGYVARLTHRVQEFKTDAPEGSSFESCCDYAVKSLPDAQAARIAALEGDVSRLNEALNSIKLDRESSDITWCPQCGPHVSVDDEGLCEMCGATSVGAGAARAVALVEENAGLKGRLRETCQILVESVGGLGPCSAEDAARRAAAVVDQLRAQVTNATDNYREAWTALRMVRDALEEVGPVGCLVAEEHLPNPEPTTEAAALVAGIAKLGSRRRVDRAALHDAIAEEIGPSVYTCSREWIYWDFDVMARDDFRQYIYGGGNVDSIVDAVESLLSAPDAEKEDMRRRLTWSSEVPTTPGFYAVVNADHTPVGVFIRDGGSPCWLGHDGRRHPGEFPDGARFCPCPQPLKETP